MLLSVDNDESALEAAGAALRMPAVDEERDEARFVGRYCLWRQARRTSGIMLPSGSRRAGTARELALLALIEADALRPSSAGALAEEALLRSGDCVSRAVAAAVLAQTMHDDGTLWSGWFTCNLEPAMLPETVPVDVAVLTFRLHARILDEEGRGEDALASMRLLERIGDIRGAVRISLCAMAETARIHLARGALERAMEARERFERRMRMAIMPSAAAAFDIEVENAKLGCRFAVAAGTPLPQSLVDLVERSIDGARARGRARHAVELGLHLGAMRLRAGRTLEAQALVLDAFRRIATSGAYRCVLDDAGIFSALCACLADTDRDHGDVESVCVRLARQKAEVLRDRSAKGLLTPREEEVLPLIACGLSNKEIGRKLGIAPETVKTHIRSLFGKLGTRTRAETTAMVIARRPGGSPFGATLTSPQSGPDEF